MRITAVAIDYPRLVFLVTVLLTIFGVYAVIALPVESDPRIVIPVVHVIVPNIGAGPAINEAEITREIEEFAGQLDDLDYVESSSDQGMSIVSFVFLESADVKDSKRDVQNLVDQVRPEFPRDAEEPIVRDISFKDFSIIEVLLRGGRDLRVLRQVAESVQDRLESLPGVAGVDLWGGLEREVQVQLDPNLMNLYGLRYEEVAQAVATANTEAPTGSIDTDSARELRVRFRGKYANVDEIAETPLANRSGKIILLRDVAKVVDHHKRVTTYAETTGEPCVSLEIRAKMDINTIQTVKRVKEIVAEEQDRLGSSFKLNTIDDEAREIRLMFRQLGTSAGYGLILVLVILTIAMGLRNSLLIAFAMPFSLLVAAGFMLIAKGTIDEDLAINNMVLFSVILVIGMVVDGALIVGENIYRHIEEGRSAYEAAKIGIVEVGPAVIAADLTTVAAFIPMLLVSGIMGQFTRIMPITVAFALSASMLVDHFVLPMMSRFLMRKRKSRFAHHEANPHDLVTDIRPQQDHRRTHVVYWKALTYCLHHRWIVLVGALSGVLMSIGLFVFGVVGFVFFPNADAYMLFVYYELPVGSGPERTREVGRILETPIHQLYETGELLSPPLTVAGGSGSGRLSVRRKSGSENGRIYIELVEPRYRKRTSQQIARWLRENLPNLPDVRWEVRHPSEGPPVGADILIRVSGRQDTSMAELGRIADRVARILKDIPGTQDVDTDYRLRPETTVVPKPQVASLFGITNQMIARSTQFALNGVEITEVDFGGQEDIDVRVLNQKLHRNELKDLRELPLRAPQGRYVTLEQVADVRQTLGPDSIRHRDQNRVVRAVCDIDPDVTIVDDVFNQVQDRIAALRAEGDPDFSRNDISLFFGGENEERDKSFADLKRAMFVGAGLILIILVWQFNSFSQPVMIMSAIPLSFVGVIYGLMICGYHFSISSMIGVVALAGIVVNDAIVLVDFINKLRARGMLLEDAVIRAGQIRLRPIFLTTVTTIGGILPMALNLSGGAEFFQPLTVSIMFGLGFATALTLIVVPTAYYTQVSWAQSLERKLLARREQKAARTG